MKKKKLQGLFHHLDDEPRSITQYQGGTRVNEMMVEYVKGNSRLQLVNIDTGFVQVDGTISHHDMFDYLSLTQKGYSKAFDPVNELLTQLLQEMEGEVGRTEAEGSAD